MFLQHSFINGDLGGDIIDVGPRPDGITTLTHCANVLVGSRVKGKVNC